MQNVTNAEQTPITSQSDVPNVINFTVSDVPAPKPEFAIDVLRRQLDDLQLKTNLLQGLDHKLIQMTEPMVMDQIQKLTMEAVNEFLSSGHPGELPKKVKREKLQTGHGTISVVEPMI